MYTYVAKHIFFNIDDRNSYLWKLYEEFKKEEDLLREDPEK